MQNTNTVFIARSLDGYIADRNGGLEWLERIPNPDGLDMGYVAFMERTDALVMGRVTFETVLGFGIAWPYTKPVFVLSRTLRDIPEDLKGKVHLVNGGLREVLNEIHNQGYHRLYIDGGATIQSFLQEDLIDELILTTMPILLGGGIPLFTNLPQELEFNHISSEVFLDEVVQDRYLRKR